MSVKTYIRADKENIAHIIIQHGFALFLASLLIFLTILNMLILSVEDVAQVKI